MLTAPPKVNDILMFGEYNPLYTYRNGDTFIVESIDGLNYTLRLNSCVAMKRRVPLRYFIKSSRSKRVITDAILAQSYSNAETMLKDELKDVAKRYFEATGVQL